MFNKVPVMKTFTLFAVILLAFQSVHGQEIDSLSAQSRQELYDFHFEKHKKQKKAGLILLGSGVVATVTGTLVARNSDLLGEDTEGFDFGASLAVVGSLATITSIPILISSGVHKRKASAYVNVSGNRRMDLAAQGSQVVSVGVKIEF